MGRRAARPATRPRVANLDRVGAAGPGTADRTDERCLDLSHEIRVVHGEVEAAPAGLQALQMHALVSPEREQTEASSPGGGRHRRPRPAWRARAACSGSPPRCAATPPPVRAGDRRGTGRRRTVRSDARARAGRCRGLRRVRAVPEPIAGAVRAAGSGCRRAPGVAMTSDLSTSESTRSTTSMHDGTGARLAAHRECSCEIETAGEHRRPPEHHLLRLGEQAVRPLDGCGQGAVPRQRTLRCHGQQPDGVVEVISDLRWIHAAQTRRSQLEPEWDSVDAFADAIDRVIVAGAGRPRRPRRAATVDEQGGLPHSAPRPIRVARDSATAHHRLTGDAQRFAGGCQDPHVRRFAQHPCDEAAGRAVHVLAVVEQEEAVGAGEGTRSRHRPQRSRWPTAATASATTVGTSCTRRRRARAPPARRRRLYSPIERACTPRSPGASCRYRQRR